MRKRNDVAYRKILNDIFNALFHAFGPQHWWPGDTAFEVAIGAILTQNTNWANVEKAINNLKEKEVLSARALHAMSHKQLASLIKPAGYFNVKAERLKEFLSYLSNHYRGSIQRMKGEDSARVRESLLGVKGIGPETADSILLYALDKPVFVIDAYTKRVLSRHRLVSEKADYHELQQIFHNNLPIDITLYNEFHALFVKVGKDYCKPQPKCNGCPLQGISLD